MDAVADLTDDIVVDDNSDDDVKSEVGLEGLTYKTGPVDVPVFDELEAEVFTWVDVEATFVGGFIEMSKHINKTVKYPEIAIAGYEEGTVAITFVVEVDGKITNIFVVNGVSRSLDREAKRIVRSFPNWVAGEINAKKVRTRVRLPIVFTLQ